MPNGWSAEQIVIAAPPPTATLLIVWSTPDQKATDVPSGENTGLKTAFADSDPTMSRGSESAVFRMYNLDCWPVPATLATYAIWVPSGEIATNWRVPPGNT